MADASAPGASPPASPGHPNDGLRRQAWLLAAVVLAIGVGVLARSLRLGSWPALNADEAINGVFATRIIDGGTEAVRPTRQYFSAVFPLSLVPCMTAFGRTALALRVLSLFTGLAAILCTSLAAARIFRGPGSTVAILGAALLPLPIAFGRVGYDVVLLPCMLACSLYAGVIASQERNWIAAFASGAFLAFATYLHPVASLLLPASVIVALVYRRGQAYWRGMGIVLGIAITLSFPAMALLTGPSGDGVTGAFSRRLANVTDIQRWQLRVSPTLMVKNAVAVCDHWTGTRSLQFLLGQPSGVGLGVTWVLRVLGVAAWIVVLAIVASDVARGGQLVLLLGVILLFTYLTRPDGQLPSGGGRYLLTTVPLVPLLLGFVTESERIRRRWRNVLVGGFLATWLALDALLIAACALNVTGYPISMNGPDGDPKQALTEYLMCHVDREDEVVITQTWWSYWPIAFYSRESVPAFTSDLVAAEYERPQLPKSRGRAWYVRLPGDDPPAFAVTRVAGWPPNAPPEKQITLSLADDTDAATGWAINDYRERMRRRGLPLPEGWEER
jgi:hypothetical protein